MGNNDALLGAAAVVLLLQFGLGVDVIGAVMAVLTDLVTPDWLPW